MEVEEYYQINHKLFQCPICYTTPLTKIFQCANGHLLCDLCSAKTGDVCPQCRIPFGNNKVRNLALEVILDEVNMPCPSKQYGCTQMMKRHEVIAHTKLCAFRKVNICANLGYKKCKNMVRSGLDLIAHLQNAHHMDETEFSNQTAIGVLIRPKSKKIRTAKYFVHSLKAEINGKVEPFLFVVKMTADSNQQNSHCAVLYLGDAVSQKAEDFNAKIDFIGEQERKKTHICTWSGAPLHFKSAEDASVIPYFSTSIHYIRNRLNPGKDIEFEAKLTMEMAVPSWDHNKSSSGKDSSSDSDEKEVSNAATCSRSGKRRLRQVLVTSKLKKCK